MSRAK